MRRLVKALQMNAIPHRPMALYAQIEKRDFVKPVEMVEVIIIIKSITLKML